MPEVLRTTGELEAFQPEWRRLWGQDPNATPFQHPDWLLPWWRQFGGSDLWGIVARRSGEPVAFLPFYRYSERRSGERQLLLLGVGTSDYLDGIFAPGCAMADVLTALEMLRDEGGWDVMIAGQLRPPSMLLHALQKRERPFLSVPCRRMPASRIPELPAAIRRNVMYYRNRAMRCGSLELKIADSSTWPECFNALVRLHTADWRRRGLPGVLADPRVLAWHREAIPRLQTGGLLRLYSLHLNREAIAVAYSLADPPGRAERALYYYLPSYSLDHANLRPGTLLLALAMENAAQEGIQWVDLLRGDEAYKTLWHAEARATYGFALRSHRREGELAA